MERIFCFQRVIKYERVEAALLNPRTRSLTVQKSCGSVLPILKLFSGSVLPSLGG